MDRDLIARALAVKAAREELERRNARPRYHALVSALEEADFERVAAILREVPTLRTTNPKAFPRCMVRNPLIASKIDSLLPLADTEGFPDAVTLLVCHQDEVAAA